MSDTVGSSSHRSPSKHLMQRTLAISEVVSAPQVVASMRQKARTPLMYNGHLLVDLTAGDAAGDGVNPWWRGSSPAILAHIASKYRAIRVRLYEIERGTYGTLIANLALRMPQVGFIHVRDASWIHQDTASTVEAICGDSRVLENFADLRPYEWLFVNNDPNSMNGWALNMAHLADTMMQMRRYGCQVCTLSTMGFNAGGCKIVELERRAPSWFPPIERSIGLLAEYPRLDLILRRVVGDFNQWAYLLMVPASKAIPRQIGQIEVLDYSWRRNTAAFEAAISELFYSKQQRANGHVWRTQYAAATAPRRDL